jgi:membrane protease YdiL (CAAX protease family)
MNPTPSLATIYLIILAVFILGFLINWYRNRTTMAAYKRIGFRAAIIFVIFELLLLAITRSQFFIEVNVLVVVATLGVGILRVWAVVNNGIFFSNQLGIRSFPLLAPRLGLSAVPAETPVVIPAAVVVEGSGPEPLLAASTLAYANEAPAVSALATAPEASMPLVPPSIPWPRYWLTIAGLALAAVAYSAVLFLIAHPQIGLFARDLVSSDVQVLTPLTLVIILEFAFAEELIFRLGIQNYLGAKLINKRYGYAGAIVLTAALWTLGHVGSLDPDWVKLAQVFPLGLALGWLYRKYGIESTILVHGLFNVVGALVLPPLYLG